MKSFALALVPLLLLPSICTGASHPLTVLRISQDGRALEIQRLGDTHAKRIDILAKCGMPAVGEPRVRAFEQSGGIIHVYFGKHCSVEITIRDFSVACTGCD